MSSAPSILNYDRFQSTEPLPHENMIFVADVMFLLKVGKTKLYGDIRAGRIPGPVDKYNGKSAWRKDEILKCANQRFSKFQRLDP